jgi:hypothetical protein
MNPNNRTYGAQPTFSGAPRNNGRAQQIQKEKPQTPLAVKAPGEPNGTEQGFFEKLVSLLLKS